MDVSAAAGELIEMAAAAKTFAKAALVSPELGRDFHHISPTPSVMRTQCSKHIDHNVHRR